MNILRDFVSSWQIMEHQMSAEYIESVLQQRRARNRWFCLGLGNNVDEEIAWDQKVLQDLIIEHLSSSEIPEQLPGHIATPGDFLTLVVILFRQGKGAELPLMNEAMCRFLKKHFQCQRTLGGTGARAGRALATLGFRVFVHLNILSDTVRDLLDVPALYTVLGQEMVKLADLNDLGQDHYAPHFIVQFSEGDELQIGRETIRCPQSNRVILPYDEINTTLILNSSYFNHIVNMGKGVASVVVSGFNAMIDEELLLIRLQEVADALQPIKSQKTPIYLEDGGYHRPAYKQHVLRQLGPIVDVFGMNEDELTDISGLHHKTVDITDLFSILNSLEFLFEQYNLRNVILHTKDFALYYGQDRYDEIEAGLTLANALAGTRARIGRDGTLDEIHTTLALPESPQGRSFQQQAQNTILNRYLVVSPARYIPQPSCTIGLGDTFVAGFQICF
jgi:ADP-dependent phosphofructokinase/glucokinase